MYMQRRSASLLTKKKIIDSSGPLSPRVSGGIVVTCKKKARVVCISLSECIHQCWSKRIMTENKPESILAMIQILLKKCHYLLTLVYGWTCQSSHKECRWIGESYCVCPILSGLSTRILPPSIQSSCSVSSGSSQSPNSIEHAIQGKGWRGIVLPAPRIPIRAIEVGCRFGQARFGLFKILGMSPVCQSPCHSGHVLCICPVGAVEK